MSKPETDLERRALLGDQEAQEELTRQGIVLPCWRCGGEAEVEQLNAGGKPVYAVSCKKHYCGAYGCAHPTAQKAIKYWNTRPAPPIGRCKDCDCYWPNAEQCGHSGETVKENDFCSKFKPKEAPND